MSIYVLHLTHNNRRNDVLCYRSRVEVESFIIDFARMLWTESGHAGPLPSGQELLDFLADMNERVHVFRCELDNDSPGDEIELTLNSKQEAAA